MRFSSPLSVVLVQTKLCRQDPGLVVDAQKGQRFTVAHLVGRLAGRKNKLLALWRLHKVSDIQLKSQHCVVSCVVMIRM